MPTQYEKQKYRLGEARDGRRKLSVEEKELIRCKYLAGGVSQRELAKYYGVSRRLIVFSIYPERMHAVPWKKYYTTEKRKLYQRKHRARLAMFWKKDNL